MQASEKKPIDITSVLGQGVYVVDKNNELAFMNPKGERKLYQNRDAGFRLKYLKLFLLI